MYFHFQFKIIDLYPPQLTLALVRLVNEEKKFEHTNTRRIL